MIIDRYKSFVPGSRYEYPYCCYFFHVERETDGRKGKEKKEYTHYLVVSQYFVRYNIVFQATTRIPSLIFRDQF